MTDLDRFEVWFVTGSVSLYGPDALAQVAAHANEIARALDSGRIPVRVVAKPVVADADGIRQLCLDANAESTCVGLITWMHTFSPAKMWIGGLKSLQKPILHLHTQFNRDLPWAHIDMDFMNLNQSAHGDREFGFLETRMRLARKTVVGHWQDPGIQDRIALWSRAACGWHEAQHLRIARFGDNMRNVAVTEGDKVEAEIRFGISVNTYGVSDLVAMVDEVSDRESADLAAEYDDLYEVVASLRPGGDRRNALLDAARIELGLRRFLDEGGFSAFTDNFEDLGGLKQLPGIGTQRLMADGFGFGGEGDWKAAALLRIVKVMTQDMPGGTSFMEDYTYHLAPGAEKILGAHMLEICPTISSETPTCEIHPLSLGAREDPVRLVFTAAPGPGVVVAMLDLGERFRLVANEIDLVDPDAALPNLPVARAIWEPRPSLATAAEAWLVAGGPHHTILTTAATADLLADFAVIAQTELLLIDAESRMADIAKELRWNQTYYYLARGL